MKILVIICFIAMIILIVRKAAVIGVAIFFGSILLMLSVTVLRDQLHIPINDYIDTTQIDELRDKVVPIQIGTEKESDIVEDEINYDLLTDEEIVLIVGRLNGEEDIKIKDIENIEKDLIANTELDKENIIKENKKNEEDKSNKFQYKYKDLTNEERENIYKEIGSLISDDRFYNKLMGMSNYVEIEYDLGNGKMYNSGDKKELIILIYK